MMALTLPFFPRFVFTIFEPLSLVAGWLGPTFSTQYFVRAQLPSVSTETAWEPSTWPTTQILALQLGNVYGLLALIGVGVLYQTTEPKVIRNFLVACAVGDLGHLYVTYEVMGKDFWDIGHWNDLAWGNIGITSFLFATRCLQLAGAFGKGNVTNGNMERRKIV